MSADRWAICPGCVKKAKEAQIALLDKMHLAYGKVSEDEYYAMLEELQVMDRLPDRTLREDWNLGIRDGVFGISYLATCSECGFKKLFEHREAIEL